MYKKKIQLIIFILGIYFSILFRFYYNMLGRSDQISNTFFKKKKKILYYTYLQYVFFNTRISRVIRYIIMNCTRLQKK